jgi:cytochrome c-type biogenesis protein CcmE
MMESMDNDAFPEDDQFQESGSLFRGRGRLIIGGILFFGALFYFAFLSFQGSTVYYLTVDELQDKGSAAYGVQNRVSGKLVPGSFLRETEGTVASFVLADEDGQYVMNASFDGVVPDLFFNDHSEIIAEGSYSPEGVFHADQIIVKCPSKYASEA